MRSRTPQSNPRKRAPPRKRQETYKDMVGRFHGHHRQFYWPSVGNSVAAYGRYFRAANNQVSRLAKERQG